MEKIMKSVAFGVCLFALTTNVSLAESAPYELLEKNWKCYDTIHPYRLKRPLVFEVSSTGFYTITRESIARIRYDENASLEKTDIHGTKKERFMQFVLGRTFYVKGTTYRLNGKPSKHSVQISLKEEDVYSAIVRQNRIPNYRNLFADVEVLQPHQKWHQILAQFTQRNINDINEEHHTLKDEMRFQEYWNLYTQTRYSSSRDERRKARGITNKFLNDLRNDNQIEFRHMRRMDRTSQDGDRRKLIYMADRVYEESREFKAACSGISKKMDNWLSYLQTTRSKYQSADPRKN